MTHTNTLTGTAANFTTPNAGLPINNGNFFNYDCYFADNATETLTQVKVGVAGIAYMMGTHLNNAGTTRTLTIRKNAANGNQTLTDATGADAWYYDAVNTDSLAVGDVVDYQFSYTGTQPSTFGYTGLFRANSGMASIAFGASASGNNFVGNFYGGILDGPANDATESDNQQRIRASGTHTLQYFQINVYNATTNTRTATFRKNGANGNSTVSVTGSATGIFVDTTHTDTFTVADLIGHSTGVFTTENVNWTIGSTIVWGSSVYEICCSNHANRAAGATVNYAAIKGRFGWNAISTTESTTSIALKYNGGTGAKITNVRINVVVNTYAASVVWQLRKNSNNANNSATITAGATGWFEDTTHSDTWIDTDLFNYSISGGTSGSMGANVTMMTVDNGSTVGTTESVPTAYQIGASFSQRVRSIGY